MSFFTDLHSIPMDLVGRTRARTHLRVDDVVQEFDERSNHVEVGHSLLPRELCVAQPALALVALGAVLLATGVYTRECLVDCMARMYTSQTRTTPQRRTVGTDMTLARWPQWMARWMRLRRSSEKSSAPTSATSVCMTQARTSESLGSCPRTSRYRKPW